MCAHINPYFTAHKPSESEWAPNAVQGMGAWLLSSSVNPVCSALEVLWLFFSFFFFVSVRPRLPHWGGDSWAATVGGHPVRQKPSRRLAMLPTAGVATSGKIHQHAAHAAVQTLACFAEFLTASTLFTRCGSLTLFVYGFSSQACRFSPIYHCLSTQHCQRHLPLLGYFSAVQLVPLSSQVISFSPVLSIYGPNTSALLATLRTREGRALHYSLLNENQI